MRESLCHGRSTCGYEASTLKSERERTSVFFLVESVTEALVKPAYFPFACGRARETEWFLLYSANQCSESAVPQRAVDECCRRTTVCWVRPMVRNHGNFKGLIIPKHSARHQLQVDLIPMMMVRRRVTDSEWIERWPSWESPSEVVSLVR